MLFLVALVWICSVTGFLAFETHAYPEISIVKQLPVALVRLRNKASSAVLGVLVAGLLAAAALIGTYMLFRILVWIMRHIF